MNFLTKILAWFGFDLIKSSTLTKLKEENQSLKTFQLTPDSKSILEKIENEKIAALERTTSALVVAVCNMNNKLSEEKEFLVAIATLQEQLLHELDQGKVVIVKANDTEYDSDMFSEEENETVAETSIKKYDLN